MNFEVSEYMNILIVLFCICLGFMVKEFTLFNKIDNKNIPPFLCLVGGITGLVLFGFTLDNFVTGFISGLISVGSYEMFVRRILEWGGKDK